MGTRNNENVTKTKSCRNSPFRRDLQAQSGETTQQGADNSNIPPQDADKTSNPAEAGGVSRGQELVTVVQVRMPNSQHTEICCEFFWAGFLSSDNRHYYVTILLKDVGVISLILVGSTQPVISTTDLPAVRNLP
jgi:hypothetical protein